MYFKCELIIGGYTHEISNDLKNWDDVSIAYNRPEYDGVVRSYSTKFEFVNRAYSLLRNEYRQKYLSSAATVIIYKRNNSWLWSELFQCSLDFSTFSDDGYTVSINAIDDSLASIIKAKKGTQYEYVVSEIKEQTPLYYDRIKMMDKSKHIILSDSYEDTSVLKRVSLGYTKAYTVNGNVPPCYRNIFLSISSSSESASGYMEFYDQSKSGLDSNISYQDWNSHSNLSQKGEGSIELGDGMYVARCAKSVKDLSVKLNFNISVSKSFGSGTEDNRGYTFSFASNLTFNVLRGVVSSGNTYNLSNIYSKTLAVNSVAPIAEDLLIDINEGELLVVMICMPYLVCNEDRSMGRSEKVDSDFYGIDSNYDIIDPVFSASYFFRNSPEFIDVITPLKVLNRLLKSINEGKDGISGEIVSEVDDRLGNSVIVAAESIRDLPNAKLYLSYEKFKKWMEAEFGYVPIVGTNKVTFVHRNSLFIKNVSKTIGKNISEFEYKVNSSLIYSRLRVGYEKQDYDSVNGRDEFRFTNEYTTGNTLTDNSIELISPLRADAYGIEFLVQKRGKETTDDESDNDVFFVGAVKDAIIINPIPPTTMMIAYVLVREGYEISGVINADTMFNSMYSPRFMIEANRRFIGASIGKLTFASSDGNSDVTINGVNEKDDILINDRLFTVGEIEFKTSDLNIPSNWSESIVVEYMGDTYSCHVIDVKITGLKDEGVKYSLVVDDIA